jgi:hypothetical protein
MRTTARGARGRTIGVAAAAATAQAQEGSGLTAAARPMSLAPTGADAPSRRAVGRGCSGTATPRHRRR